MKNIRFTLTILSALIISLGAVSAQKTSSIYDYQFSLDSLEGGKVDFSKFKGKKVLFVNVASKCGYTSQYTDLQKLHELYKNELIIVALPCNQFGNQEPGSAEDIANFCEKNYGVTFLVTEKVKVKGDAQNSIYGWLTQKSQNRVLDSQVSWNFQKYLIDEEGKLLKMFSSSTKPLSSEIIDLL